MNKLSKLSVNYLRISRNIADRTKFSRGPHVARELRVWGLCSSVFHLSYQ